MSSGHPEGGFYREIFRAGRGSMTAIYFLLVAGLTSAAIVEWSLVS
jgi:predicted cupin superfamily sugar epimerase